MEDKRLDVNIGKTNVNRCKNGVGKVENTGKFACGIVKKGVETNSVRCTACNSGNIRNVAVFRGRLQGASGY